MICLSYLNNAIYLIGLDVVFNGDSFLFKNMFYAKSLNFICLND